MARALGLTVEGISVERGGRAVLSNLSFDLPEGTALMVTGDNGAGKSTLLRAVAGLLPLAGGAISLRVSTIEADVPVAEASHYIGHANGLKPALSAAENLAFQQAWSGGSAVDPPEALAAVGLSHIADFPVSVLSAGQRRRIALARLLVSQKPLWLLDEPATAIDARSEAILSELIARHLARGGLLLAAVHTPLSIEARRLRLGA